MKKTIIFVLLLLLAFAAIPAPGGEIKVAHSQNTKFVPLYEVFEITFRHDQKYKNPFFDVTIEVEFTSPGGKKVNIGGFHYGSSEPPEIRVTKTGEHGRERRKTEYIFKKQDLWKARFAPRETGKWKYSYTFSNVKGDKATGEGSFTCVKGKKHNPGFVRQSKTNPFRWVFDDGSPYYPIGLQKGWFDNSGTGSTLDQVGMEGPFRTDRTNIVKLPKGPLYVRGPSNNPLNADIYFRRYGRCGFNLLRFSQCNFAFNLYRDLDNWYVQEGIMCDELLGYARKYGFRIFYGIFGYQKVFTMNPDNKEGMEKVKRFVKYSVDRWGAYVDFWQFLNEQKASDKWYEIMAPYLRSIDPYDHPITTSWEKPHLKGIEINAPHWYQNENELKSDSATANRAKRYKKHGKPVILGEQGNSVGRKKPRPIGIGGVWDAGSARRMRIRTWTAFFHEIAFIFWETSYARDGHVMNIWLGPTEREYVRSLQDFSYRLDKDAKPVEVEVSDPHAVRAYGLASKEQAAVYLHHFSDHDNPVKNIKVTLEIGKAAKGYWYSPATAEILGTFDAKKGKNTFEAPPFTVDIALLVTPDGPPDIDGDGIPNDKDTDDDNDGHPDKKDAFPLEPEEWQDNDGDLIGDVLDADDDGDGKADDLNRNGKPDRDELDIDGDGVDCRHSVPWDAFPFDPKESRDTDGDGIGDNADADDDDDGFTDAQEKKAGTDPLDKLSFPVKPAEEEKQGNKETRE